MAADYIALVVVTVILLGLCMLGGRHRGTYVENPAWRTPPFCVKDGYLVWEGSVTLSNLLPQSEVTTFTVTPSDATLYTLPALVGKDQAQEIRDIVNDELNATPIYTGLKYEPHGRFGDVDIDRADTAPLRPLLPAGGSGD